MVLQIWSQHEDISNQRDQFKGLDWSDWALIGGTTHKVCKQSTTLAKFTLAQRQCNAKVRSPRLKQSRVYFSSPIFWPLFFSFWESSAVPVNTELTWSVAPGLVVTGEDSKMAATDKVLIVQAKQRVGGVEELRMEDNLSHVKVKKVITIWSSKCKILSTDFLYQFRLNCDNISPPFLGFLVPSNPTLHS